MSVFKQWLTQTTEKRWYDEATRGLWWYLFWLPLEWVYKVLSAHQHQKSRQKQQAYAVPIAVVGNITVGGTGKTPLLIHLVEQLKQLNISVGVVSRGYGGQVSSGDMPLLLTPATTALQAGDEPVLIAKRTHVPVCVHPKRHQAIQALLSEHPDCQIILSDDGLQHYQMHRDLEIVVVDGERRFGNRHCLPAGPLREPLKRLQNVDFVVVNGRSPDWFNMGVVGDVLYHVNDANRAMPLSRLFAQPVRVVTGIGNPKRFFARLQEEGLRAQYHTFPDHYTFQKNDLCFEDNLPIVMTEKDAVKCQAFDLPNAWYLAIDAQPDEAFTQAFLQRVKELIHE